jgi:hypothetical protein
MIKVYQGYHPLGLIRSASKVWNTSRAFHTPNHGITRAPPFVYIHEVMTWHNSNITDSMTQSIYIPNLNRENIANYN